MGRAQNKNQKQEQFGKKNKATNTRTQKPGRVSAQKRGNHLKPLHRNAIVPHGPQWHPSTTWGNPAPRRDSTTVRDHKRTISGFQLKVKRPACSLIQNGNHCVTFRRALTKERQPSQTLKTPARVRTGCAAARPRRSAKQLHARTTVRHQYRQAQI